MAVARSSTSTMKMRMRMMARRWRKRTDDPLSI
jgi:hypothetical protein